MDTATTTVPAMAPKVQQTAAASLEGRFRVVQPEAKADTGRTQ